MKLIYCPDCRDMIKLRKLEFRHCACGHSWGYYFEDDLTAEIGGSAAPVAIENDELREAVLRRPREGRGSCVEDVKNLGIRRPRNWRLPSNKQGIADRIAA